MGSLFMPEHECLLCGIHGLLSNVQLGSTMSFRMNLTRKLSAIFPKPWIAQSRYRLITQPNADLSAAPRFRGKIPLIGGRITNVMIQQIIAFGKDHQLGTL